MPGYAIARCTMLGGLRAMTPRAHHTAPGGTHVALPHMTLALLIGVPLALIVAYAFWMGGRIGDLGPLGARDRGRVAPPKKTKGTSRTASVACRALRR